MGCLTSDPSDGEIYLLSCACCTAQSVGRKSVLRARGLCRENGGIRISSGGMAEREGFEPPIQLPVCRISSAVLSTAQPPLRAFAALLYGETTANSTKRIDHI